MNSITREAFPVLSIKFSTCSYGLAPLNLVYNYNEMATAQKKSTIPSNIINPQPKTSTRR